MNIDVDLCCENSGREVVEGRCGAGDGAADEDISIIDENLLASVNDRISA